MLINEFHYQRGNILIPTLSLEIITVMLGITEAKVIQKFGEK